MKKLLNIHLHLGAPKTATTHIQNLLEQKQKYLHENNIDYVTRSELREKKVTRKITTISKKLHPHHTLTEFLIKRNILKLRKGSANLLISEENLIGGLGITCDNNHPFPKLENRIRALNTISSWTNLNIFFAVRCPHSFLPSAYVQSLRTKLTPGGFEAIKYNTLANPLCWTDIIERIKLILPKANLTIWKFEEYINNPQEILSTLCGIDLDNLNSISIPPETRSPSSDAINEIEILSPDLNMFEYKYEVQKIIDKDKGNNKFQPFNKEETKHLKDFYKNDMLQLDAKFPDTLLHI